MKPSIKTLFKNPDTLPKPPWQIKNLVGVVRAGQKPKIKPQPKPPRKK